MAASEAMAGKPPSEAPLNMEIVAFMGIAASWSKKRQQAARDGLERPTKKPDLDNIVKAVKDGLNGVAWKDDSQVVRLTAGKYWSDKPRVEVRIWEWAA
jgi:Holliday junction resolvase RusA-like endonuclease